MDPIVLPANQPADRFYRGGARIAEFRGEPSHGTRVPEDWVASTTTIAGEESLGLTTLPGGAVLRDEVERDPVSWLGAEHVGRFGPDAKLLVKLLDAGQRLPVHAHPATEFAHQHLSRAHGKAEAWFILEAGEVYLGLTEAIHPADLLALVVGQDIENLLSKMHRRHVEVGDTVYVPPGVLHAIGADTFLAEVQEPEDLSILLEWRGFELDGRRDGHLGLGFETALDAVEVRARSDAEISALITSGARGDSVLAEASTEFFRLGHYVVDGMLSLEAGFAVLIVTDGSLRLEFGPERALDLPRGSTVVVPHSAGPLAVSGPGRLLVCRPPAV
ncbi:MAG: mannose-6-phosphate isomerase [Microbacteriaceae bacterium]|nr:mannose-6-phosphate isomerase [Microbacteriaceae bacterium]